MLVGRKSVMKIHHIVWHHHCFQSPQHSGKMDADYIFGKQILNNGLTFKCVSILKIVV